MRKTLIGVFSLLSCYLANAETILTVEYLDGREAKEQLAKLSKIVFDKSGNMTFSYNSGDTKDFGNVSTTQKIVFTEGTLSNIEKQSSESSIQVYPNPTAETIQIAGLKEGDVVKIYNNTGNVVLSSQDSEINVSQLANGLYFVVAGENVIKLIKK